MLAMFQTFLGVDFVLISNKMFTIAPEESEAPINISILDNGIAEDDESFTLTIRARLVGVTFLQTLQKVVTIVDDEGTVI